MKIKNIIYNGMFKFEGYPLGIRCFVCKKEIKKNENYLPFQNNSIYSIFLEEDFARVRIKKLPII